MQLYKVGSPNSLKGHYITCRTVRGLMKEATRRLEYRGSRV